MSIEISAEEKKLILEALISHKTHFESKEKINVKNLINKINSYETKPKSDWDRDPKNDLGLSDEDSWLKNSLFLRGGW